MDQTGVDFAMDVHGDEAIAANFLAGFEGIPSLEAGAAGPVRRVRRGPGRARRPISRPTRAIEIPGPGQANLSMSTAQLAERFGAVSMTLEMPFKDNAELPDPVYGWSPDRCRLLARACLDALHAIIDRDRRTIAARRWRRLMPQLVLIRHGQSAWNLENRFTGWWDVGLTAQGEEEAKQAGELLAAKGLRFRPLLHLLQTRAIKTLHIALEAMGRLWLPEEKHWRLNERHYGGLTGLDKAETAARHGDEQVQIWRRSFDIPPPAAEPGGDFDLTNDRRYAGIPIPTHESLKDTIARVLPYWEERIAPALQDGRAGADLRPRQFAARPGQASLGHCRRRDRRARNPDRPADRLRARRGR